MQQQPRRHPSLIVESAGAETVVFAEETGQVHALDVTASAVFNAINGERSPRELSVHTGLDAAQVETALHALTDRGLVLDGAVTRRSALTRGALVGGAVLASPMVLSMISPQLASAVSPVAPPSGGGGGPVPLVVGTKVSLQRRTPVGDYISHSGSNTSIQSLTAGSSASARGAATFIVRQGLAGASFVSFEAADSPGLFLRHAGFVLYAVADPNNENTALFQADASFSLKPAPAGTGNAFEASQSQFAGYYIRTDGVGLYLDGPHGNADDVAFIVSSPLAP